MYAIRSYYACHPQQIEFARLNLNYTVTSKRKLNELVDEGHVRGWDDPRMPTIVGMRRRGYPPAAIRDFCERIGRITSYNVCYTKLLRLSSLLSLRRTTCRGRRATRARGRSSGGTATGGPNTT